MCRCSSTDDAFNSWLNNFTLSKSLVISVETATPEIPVAKIAVTSFVVILPAPIIGVSVFNASTMAVYPFKPKDGGKLLFLLKI